MVVVYYVMCHFKGAKPVEKRKCAKPLQTSCPIDNELQNYCTRFLTEAVIGQPLLCKYSIMVTVEYWFDSQQGKRETILSTQSRPVLRSTQPHIQFVSEFFTWQ
jgi:hypothetical protein